MKTLNTAAEKMAYVTEKYMPLSISKYDIVLTPRDALALIADLRKIRLPIMGKPMVYHCRMGQEWKTQVTYEKHPPRGWIS